MGVCGPIPQLGASAASTVRTLMSPKRMPSSASTRKLLLSKVSGRQVNLTSFIAVVTLVTRSTAATPGYNVTRLMALSAASLVPTQNAQVTPITAAKSGEGDMMDVALE